MILAKVNAINVHFDIKAGAFTFGATEFEK